MQWVSDLALGPTVAWVRSLAQKLSHATGTAKKKKKKKKKKKPAELDNFKV